jgi:Thioredoxin like C-terminal domain
LSRRVAHTYEAPDSLRVNDWALSGDWTAEAESVFSNEPNGRTRSGSTRATSTS